MRTLVPNAPACSRALLLGALVTLGVGCRDLDAARDAYCEQVDCDGKPEVGLTVELAENADAAVLGECVDVTVTTPEDAPATFRVKPETEAGAGLPFLLVHPEPGCAGAAESEIEVAAGAVRRGLSFRAFTDQRFDQGARPTRVLELRFGADDEWTHAASVQIENGAFFFGLEKAPEKGDPEAPPLKVLWRSCPKLVGRLFGLESGRPARHAPGELSLLASKTPEAALAIEEGCEHAYTVDALSDEPEPVMPPGDSLVVYIAVQPDEACDWWLIGLDGVASGEVHVYDDEHAICPTG